MTKSKTTKKALLASALSLILCFTMLLGTTFAWFTDSVTSTGNIIQSGNLKVSLAYADGTKAVPDDNSADWLDASDKAIFNYNKWEPGYTDVKHIKIGNEGTLALKYQLNIAAEDAGEISELADVIDVYFIDPAKQVADRTALTDANKAGTLSEVLKGMPANASGELLEGESDTVTIALKMQESAGNKYQGLTIGAFSIQLLATQLTSEKDSFNDQYDKNAGYDMPWDGVSKTKPVADENGVYHITTAAELVGLMDVTGNSIYIGETIVLDNNIDLGGKTVNGIGGPSGQSNFAGAFDGQGFTISNFKIDATDRDYYAGLFNYVGNCGTVKNLTVKNATVMGTSEVGAVAGGVNGGPNDSSSTIDNCKAIDCTVVGVKKVGAVVGYSMGSTVTNNYAENCTVLYSEKEGAEVLGFENIGSTVKNNTYKNVTVAKGALVSTYNELNDALAAGGNVVLAGNVANNNATISNAYGKTGYSQTNGGVLDGNGHTMTVTGANGTWDSGINTTGGTIKNITVTGSFRGIFINHNSDHSEKVVLENVIIDGTTYTISCDQGTNQGLTATNCTFNGWTSYAATLGATEFIDCTFGEGNGYAYCRPYANTTFTNCVFEEGYEFDATYCTNTFINCYVGETLITADNVATLLGEDAANITVQNR